MYLIIYSPLTWHVFNSHTSCLGSQSETLFKSDSGRIQLYNHDSSPTSVWKECYLLAV